MRTTLFIIGIVVFNNFGFSQSLTKRLQEVKTRNNLIGLAVCIIENGKVTKAVNLGMRDIDRNLPIDKNTAFRVASVSKMFTVTALMQLYDKGLFHLDEDVSKYLGFELRNPNFPDAPITFSMLMSHTSSLRDGTGYDSFLMSSYNQKPFPLIKSVLIPNQMFYTDDMWSKIDSPAKGYFTYANINFGILGTLVERISGERFDKYCTAHILAPLNADASFDIRDLTNINNLGVIYRKENGNWVAQNDDRKGIRPPSRELNDYVIGSNAVLFAPQGGLRISATNLAKFLIMHKNNGQYNGLRFLSDSAARRMHQVVWTYNGKNGNSEKDFFTTYALGCMRTTKLIAGVELIGHSGDAYGLLSGLYYSEKVNAGVVFITNGGEWKSGKYSGWQSVEEEVMNACWENLFPKIK